MWAVEGVEADVQQIIPNFQGSDDVDGRAGNYTGIRCSIFTPELCCNSKFHCAGYADGWMIGKGAHWYPYCTGRNI
eukprot:829021-Pelagomonas_calceolata.AAC.1